MSKRRKTQRFNPRMDPVERVILRELAQEDGTSQASFICQHLRREWRRRGRTLREAKALAKELEAGEES